MITIRKAVVEDAPAIATVHVAAWRQTYRGIVSDEFLGDLSIQRRTQQWENSLSDEASTYHRAFVAKMDGQVVGFSNYGLPQEKKSGFDGELFAIYILQSVHKLGIGTLLVEAVVRGMRDLGYESMMVWVLRDNPARGFYERLGGVYLYEKPIDIGGLQLMEAAYGWRDLENFRRGSILRGLAGIGGG